MSPQPIDLPAALDALEFLPDRTPAGESDRQWFAEVSPYRDGGVFLVHYAGRSQWERHPIGDEIVMVIDGSTTMTMIVDGQDRSQALGPMQMVVVPRGTWHRFDTPDGAKIMTVTPQPTDHQLARPTGT